MSNVSLMEKLLDGVEVEWLPLSDVTKYEQPTKYLVAAKNYSEEFQTPVLTAGKTFILGYTDEVDGIYKASESQVIIFDDFTTANKWVDFDFKVKSSAMKMITSSDESKVLLKYIYYWMNTLPSELVDGDHKRQWIGSFAKKKLPIPCPNNPEKSLEIQAEIVRILDAFTAMTAELTAELNMRKTQYNYYREKLLASELPSSKTATLGEVLDMRAGRYIKAKDISAIKNTEHKYICFGGNGSRGFVQAYSHDGDYALIGRQGALCGNVKRATGKFYATEHAVVCTPKEDIDIDWVFHMLTFMNLNQYKSQSAQPGLAVGNLANLAINVPPISVQKKIAKILNKFDTLTTSLQEGLPREIELRQQQYEYYRDLLLSFPKPKTTQASA